MPSHLDYTDGEFLSLFRSCRLDEALFSHGAHLRLAWLHLQNSDLVTAEKLVQEQIRAYVIHLGAEDKFHVTLTISAVNAVNHFRQRNNKSTFSEFIAANPELVNNFNALIASHYSFDIFASSDARNKYIKPDRQAFC